MNPESIAQSVARIERISADDEMAHGEEDKLWLSVLREIAKGERSAEEMAAMAREAIKTNAIEFSRWRA